MVVVSFVLCSLLTLLYDIQVMMVIVFLRVLLSLLALSLLPSLSTVDPDVPQDLHQRMPAVHSWPAKHFGVENSGLTFSRPSLKLLLGLCRPGIAGMNFSCGFSLQTARAAYDLGTRRSCGFWALGSSIP